MTAGEMKTKYMSVKVSSLIEDLDDAGLAEDTEKSEGCYLAAVSAEEGGVRICYEERGEGGVVSTEITYTSGVLTVARTGAIENCFTFEEGAESKSLYRIPPYAFDATIKTKRLRGELTPTGGELSVLYDMTIGGAAKRVRMRITLGEVCK